MSARCSYCEPGNCAQHFRYWAMKQWMTACECHYLFQGCQS